MYDDYDYYPPPRRTTPPPPANSDPTQAIWQRHATDLKRKGLIIFLFLFAFWSLEIIDWVTPWWHMDYWGIHPLNIDGLRGIPFAPFLHADFAHLMANSLPFAFLGFLIIVRSIREFFFVTIITIIGGGLGIWFFGGINTIHIGSSILVFGYLGFLLASGIFERKLATIGRSMAVLFLYYSLLVGLFPSGPGISWQGHLFGFLAGGVAAYFLSKLYAHRERQERRLADAIYIYQDEVRE